MYTEMLPGNQMLALIITQVTETMAGEYICTASYARTESLRARVDLQTYGKKMFYPPQHISCTKSMFKYLFFFPAQF